jgi:hypothetical protein
MSKLKLFLLYHWEKLNKLCDTTKWPLILDERETGRFGWFQFLPNMSKVWLLNQPRRGFFNNSRQWYCSDYYRFYGHSNIFTNTFTRIQLHVWKVILQEMKRCLWIFTYSLRNNSYVF